MLYCSGGLVDRQAFIQRLSNRICLIDCITHHCIKRDNIVLKGPLNKYFNYSCSILIPPAMHTRVTDVFYYNSTEVYIEQGKLFKR